VLVRHRRTGDADACEAVARAVHRLDGYPPYLPDDLRTFILSPAIDAWVAEVDGTVAGHVALHQRSSDAVMALASAATGRPAEHLAVVARLAVAPDHRRQGIGRALLHAAAGGARGRALLPVLDVVARFGGAIALYEACGWRRAGEVTLRLGGKCFTELVFLGPPPGR
jgi:GNAT superfamily N-acetyltransferase